MGKISGLLKSAFSKLFKNEETFSIPQSPWDELCKVAPLYFEGKGDITPVFDALSDIASKDWNLVSVPEFWHSIERLFAYNDIDISEDQLNFLKSEMAGAFTVVSESVSVNPAWLQNRNVNAHKELQEYSAL